MTLITIIASGHMDSRTPFSFTDLCMLQLIPNSGQMGCPNVSRSTLKLAGLPFSNLTIQELVIGLSQLIILKHKNSIKVLNTIRRMYQQKVSNLTNVYTKRYSNIPIESLTTAVEHLTNATFVKL